MGISIKRDETERLAREVAKLKGESLTPTPSITRLKGELNRLRGDAPWRTTAAGALIWFGKAGAPRD